MHPLLLCIGVLAACSPSLAWDDDDDFSGGGFKSKSTQGNYGYKSNQSEETSFSTQQRNSLKVDSIQEANERQRRQMDAITEQNRRLQQEQEKGWDKLRKEQEARNNEWEAKRWREVETVAGAFVADGPYYKAGNKAVLTDKGLVYSTGNGSVVAPDGYYYKSGNLWVGPKGKLAGTSGSGDNQYIWGSDGESAISAGRGYFTERGYSWPAYSKPLTEKPSWSSR
jgi:hypothetical protein